MWDGGIGIRIRGLSGIFGGSNPSPTTKKKTMTTQEILDFTINYFGRDILKRRRQSKLVEARYVFYYYARKYSSERPSMEEIGKVCAGRTHATVFNGLKKFNNWYETDKEFVDMINHYHASLDAAGGIIDPNDQGGTHSLKKRIEVLKSENRLILEKFNLAETKNYMEEVASLQNALISLREEHEIEMIKQSKDNNLLKKENEDLKQKLELKSNQLANYIIKNKRKTSFMASDVGNAI
jgi:hypothetical protein